MAPHRGHNLVFARFTAPAIFGGIERAVDKYREPCAGHGNPRTCLMCSYVIHCADTPEAENSTTQTIVIGGMEKLIDRPKEVEAAGIQRLIPNSNVGNKPDRIVTNQMSKLMEDVASHFKGTPRNLEKLNN